MIFFIQPSRIYKVNGRLILVSAKTVTKLIQWNGALKKHAIQYDRKVCYSWLLSLVGKKDLALNNVSSDTMDFIKACFIVRCEENYNSTENRIGKIEKYKDELCKAGGVVKNVVTMD